MVSLRLCRHLFVAIVAAIPLAVGGPGAANVEQASPPDSTLPQACQTDPWIAQKDNGIAVGEPKIFDNRSMALMLDTLSESLRTIQVIDAKTLAANLNLLQGFQSQDVTRSFTVQGAPLPKIVQTADQGQQGSTSQGQETNASQTFKPTEAQSEQTKTTGSSTSSTSQSNKTETTTPQRDATIPALPDLISAPSFTPQFGQNSLDVLSDQVNLTYQIFNVRMVLERALTDRTIGDDPRLQAVLGFNISLDPPRDAQDSAAIVEVTLSPAASTEQHPVSLVALMPQEKTYNSATLSTKSTAFGGAAVAKVVTIGFDERRRSQLFYLFRDNDTLAFERMNEAYARRTTFGWEFRPVLGRRSVSPGMRQMFAVIAVPSKDVKTSSDFSVVVSVKTHWRKYFRGTSTTDEEVGFWPRVGRLASLGIAVKSPPLGRVDTGLRSCVTVPATTHYQTTLQPHIDDVTWRQTDEKTAVVSIEGRNFFQGTTVRIGGAVHADAASGLLIKSDQAVDVVTSIAGLAQPDGVLIGRYGTAIALEKQEGTGLKIETVTLDPPLGGKYQVEIVLKNRAGGDLLENDLPTTSPPLVIINGTVVPGPYDIQAGPHYIFQDGKRIPIGNRVFVRAYVPVDQIKDVQGRLTIRFPFKGSIWSDTYRVYDTDLSFKITRLFEDSTTTKLLIETKDVNVPFTTKWKVLLDKSYSVGQPEIQQLPAGFERAVLLEAAFPNGVLKDRKQLLLIDEGSGVHPVAIPDASPAPEKASLTGNQTFSVGQRDAVRLQIKGESLGKIASVTADGTKLESHAAKDGKTLDVYLSSSVTDKPHVLTLVLRDDRDGVIDTVNVTIAARP